MSLNKGCIFSHHYYSTTTLSDSNCRWQHRQCRDVLLIVYYSY